MEQGDRVTALDGEPILAVFNAHCAKCGGMLPGDSGLLGQQPVRLLGRLNPVARHVADLVVPSSCIRRIV